MKISDKGGSDFQTVDAGMYVARCYKLIDLGTQEGEYQGKPNFKREIVIGWEFTEEKMDDGQPFTTSAFYTASLGDKANLRKFLAGWRGRDFTPEELACFELKTILGQPCMLNMAANKKGKVVPVSAAPMMKGMMCGIQINETQYFSLDEDEFSMAEYEKLGAWFKDKVNKSLEFIALTSAGVGASGDSETHNDAPDDDIPF